MIWYTVGDLNTLGILSNFLAFGFSLHLSCFGSELVRLRKKVAGVSHFCGFISRDRHGWGANGLRAIGRWEMDHLNLKMMCSSVILSKMFPKFWSHIFSSHLKPILQPSPKYLNNSSPTSPNEAFSLGSRSTNPASRRLWASWTMGSDAISWPRLARTWAVRWAAGGSLDIGLDWTKTFYILQRRHGCDNVLHHFIASEEAQWVRMVRIR